MTETALRVYADEEGRVFFNREPTDQELQRMNRLLFRLQLIEDENERLRAENQSLTDQLEKAKAVLQP